MMFLNGLWCFKCFVMFLNVFSRKFHGLSRCCVDKCKHAAYAALVGWLDGPESRGGLVGSDGPHLVVCGACLLLRGCAYRMTTSGK